MHRLSVAASRVWDVVKGCLTPARSRWKLSGAQSPDRGMRVRSQPGANERSPELRCPALCCTDTTTF